MKVIPPALLQLIREFHKLPGIGYKTSERFVYHLLKGSQKEIDALAKSLQDVKEVIQLCKRCYTYTEKEEFCTICRDTQRDQHLLCIVAEPKDMLIIEQTGNFSGIYHVLGGVISPTTGSGPHQLRIDLLEKRVEKENFSEIIFAFNPDMEGDTTALYIAQLLQGKNITLTKIARGLPMGADIQFADEVTLGNALAGRQPFEKKENL